MKVFFGYKIEKGKAILEDSSRFVKRSISDEQRELYNESTRKFEVAKKAKFPKILEIPMSIICLIVIIGLLAFEFSNMSVAEAFEQYPAISTIVVISLIAFVATLVYIFIRQKLLGKSDEYFRLKTAKQRMQEQCYAALDVPYNSQSVDVFLAQYKIKNETVKLVGMSNLLNHKIYLIDDEICLANELAVLSIPVTSAKSIVKIKKQMHFNNWEREESYRKFGVKKGKYDYYVTEYYALKLEFEDELYEIYFPAYSLLAFEHLTGLKAE